MKFETERLILRDARLTDLNDLFEGASDLEVTRNLSLVPHPLSKKDELEWLKRKVSESRKKKRECYTFVLELKSEKRAIGVTSIDSINHNYGVATTGSWIGRKYWRKGYILEAKIPVLDFAFNKLKLRKIETSAFAENIASQKMSETLGFKQEGLKRKAAICKATGKIHDEYIYGLLKEEWIKNRPRLIKKVKERAERET